jgi:hypothetical protein
MVREGSLLTIPHTPPEGLASNSDLPKLCIHRFTGIGHLAKIEYLYQFLESAKL